ncbi:capsule assembly Wzi family protein, partial [Acinetobacter baumannii]|uniref:capsule assembly Wzi family protein n=1 Tax=Acinetobacter baumannii TaxID=470 RepID=UPI001C092806
VYATNTDFEHTNTYGAVTKGSYLRVLPGQSSIRLSTGPVSLGISTENLWWGPGCFNALLMSNNAPGFLHLTFNTTRPVKTPIGSFE